MDCLLLNAGRFLTADAIINHVWSVDGGDRDRLRRLVHRLRSKLARASGADTGALDPDRHAYLETIPRLGYGLMVFSASEADQVSWPITCPCWAGID